jgi:hypothetical protein
MRQTTSWGLDKSTEGGLFNNSNIIPAAAGGAPIIFNYNNNGISTANEAEVTRMLTTLMPAVNRKMGR